MTKTEKIAIGGAVVAVAAYFWFRRARAAIAVATPRVHLDDTNSTLVSYPPGSAPPGSALTPYGSGYAVRVLNAAVPDALAHGAQIVTVHG